MTDPRGFHASRSNNGYLRSALPAPLAAQPRAESARAWRDQSRRAQTSVRGRPDEEVPGLRDRPHTLVRLRHGVNNRQAVNLHPAHRETRHSVRQHRPKISSKRRANAGKLMRISAESVDGPKLGLHRGVRRWGSVVRLCLQRPREVGCFIRRYLTWTFAFNSPFLMQNSSFEYRIHHFE